MRSVNFVADFLAVRHQLDKACPVWPLALKRLGQHEILPRLFGSGAASPLRISLTVARDVEEEPGISIRRRDTQLGISRRSLCRIFVKKNGVGKFPGVFVSDLMLSKNNLLCQANVCCLKQTLTLKEPRKISSYKIGIIDTVYHAVYLNK